jgi:hypothetical protein
LGQWIFEQWPGPPCQSYKNAFVSVFCVWVKVAGDAIQSISY